MAKKTTKTTDTIKVGDFNIKIGAIYKLSNRLDRSAPDAYIEHGTTKVPSYEVGNLCSVNVVGDVWDTGLYEDSPCYAMLPKDEVKLIVNSINKYLVEPYERRKGIPGILSHSNDEFWAEYTYKLKVDRAFRTEDPNDLLDLIQSLISCQIVPKDMVGNPKFIRAQYVLEDVTKSRGFKEEINNEFMVAVSNFGKLLEANRNLALKVLEYVGLNEIADDINDSSLNSMVFSWLMANDKQNPSKFNSVYEKVLDSEGSEEVLLHGEITRAVRRGIITNMNGEYYYGEVLLGIDVKTAAKNVNEKEELSDIKDKLMSR